MSDAPSSISPEPVVRLENAFHEPFNNAVATARTCYSSRVITAADVDKDDASREQRDRIARSTYEAGHHTTLQHASFQFVLERVSRQLLWSVFHAHPFYNSEQVSQRYVEVKAGNYAVPRMLDGQRALYEEACAQQMAAYHALIEALTPSVGDEYFRLFPARRKQADKHRTAIKKRAMEVARYVLPVATHAHLYHTVSGLTLHRYHRLSQQLDCPVEARVVIGKMVDAVRAHDPLFFRDAEDPLPLEQTHEHLIFEGLLGSRKPGFDARAFVDEFDASLGDYRSRLVDWKVNAEAQTAQAVRSVLGVTTAQLSDDDALKAVLSPEHNPYLSEALRLTTLGKLTRALSHAHYTFRKKLSHTADSQDQRHRMVPGSRPILEAHYVPGRPDYILPDLITRNDRALALYLESMTATWQSIDALVNDGVPLRDALYLLPNAFPIRFEESGELTHQHHKWTQRLCYLAQEEIWQCSVEEVRQVREVHPRIGALLLPPCGLRHLAGRRPVCPEGERFCGVTVWKLDVDEYTRLI